MSDRNRGAFTVEELLGAAQGNWNGLAFVLTRYLKEHSLSLVEMWHYTGRHFAEFWTPGIDALGMASGAAINWASIGSKVVEISGDANRSTLVLTGWPPANFLQGYGLQREELDTMCEIMRPIAARLGFDFEWKREGDRLIQVYSRKSQAP